MSAEPTRPVYVKKLDAWSIRLTVDPLAVPLTEFVARWRWITPNAITLFSFVLTLVAIWCFLLGTHVAWMIGAVVWHLGNVFDATDGKLARKLAISSPFGAKLDGWLDKVKKILSFAALIVASPEHVPMLAGLALGNYLLQRVPVRPNASLSAYCHARGWTMLFDPLDAVFFLFVLGPLTGQFAVWLGITVFCQVAHMLLNSSLNAFSRKP
jgi:phosphatidylglycerophosphate synthase